MVKLVAVLEQERAVAVALRQRVVAAAQLRERQAAEELAEPAPVESAWPGLLPVHRGHRVAELAASLVADKAEA